MPASKLCDVLPLAQNNTHRDLAGPSLVGAVIRDRGKRVTAKAALHSLAKRLSQLLCEYAHVASLLIAAGRAAALAFSILPEASEGRLQRLRAADRLKPV